MNEKILIADDHGIVRIGMAMMLKKLRPHATVVEADNYAMVLDLVEKEKFDLLILDVNMPQGSFQSSVDYIKVKQPSTKILVFSALDAQLHGLRYIHAGANGFLNKLAKEDEVKKALERMFTSGNYLSDDLKDSLIFNSAKKEAFDENPFHSLSNREMEIATRLMKGMRLKDISNELNIHVSTISTYKNRIFEKLSVQSVPEMMDVFKFYDI
ncbi:DNA-binding response regulator [Arachidicoccus ginsenosidimutans]|uniref:response regulator transcription factor n=1 Tax=Arachidicoccus sp. BS20 TaxID=1850526 RepID=UPI0007F11E3A|nr:response regulator transcription factor [Arachidicoccus sp. BS20]ANI90327.1 DNA-binding response regulator [Arachidicoccus sp. BS20]